MFHSALGGGRICPELNTIAVIFPLLFFGIAIIHYVQLGLTTDNNSL
jgi:hypothetical protein